jgi:hypothetical protein
MIAALTSRICAMRRPVTSRLNQLRRRVAGGVVVRAHALDYLIALVSRRSKIFSPGWGDEDFLGELRGQVSPTDTPHEIAIAWQDGIERNGITRRDGSFASPVLRLPNEARTVHVRACTRPDNGSACVILAGSHDEGYRVRERVFGSLTARGVDLYLLENPYYGLRRIPGGVPAITVSDQALMAVGMVTEARALLTWLRSRYASIAVAGYSMGGHMAAIAAAVTPFPVACAAMATGASASSIYTRGLMSWCVDYDRLAGEPQQRTAARQRLHAFFDAADITNFPPPLRTDAAVILGCMRDGYVLRSETERLHRHWPGSDLRWLNAGHFSALVRRRRSLADCIADAISRL